MPEQSESNFQPESKGPEIHTITSCNRCGNEFDSPGNCPECFRNPKKIKYKESEENTAWYRAMERARRSNPRNASEEDLRYLAKVYLREELAQEAKKQKSHKPNKKL
ncbi:MAG: hypothetical protein KGI72_03150 [Patescibacteria group bacterium]|nr:hypothetical protein [Patescibacteria group bacterium]MDE2015496.1 hypothetical protein [Patescibacteria group bacterium]